MIRKLTHVEISRVDALCMGPAQNQDHATYEWDADRVNRMLNGEPPPDPLTSLWQKLKALFPSR